MAAKKKPPVIQSRSLRRMFELQEEARKVGEHLAFNTAATLVLAENVACLDSELELIREHFVR